ncbi:uncharacterized protein LOC126334689 isoform X3 [Schistocerca gregaria]|uniref:uncharacterized protein LOC126334689 isoform X3 n=1 Tax=Schistocerca gregaria TaxID=7010 RepID=UPI00211DE34A|nr:uncharacterized protein LOC126334689 isoform X3 [Schistocerca gregaria]
MRAQDNTMEKGFELGDPDRKFFELKRLVSVSSIRLATRYEVGRRQLLAFVIGSGDLCLYYLCNEDNEKPVMRHIPWYQDNSRMISAMCFDPSGSWLLVASCDGTLVIVPALALVDSAKAKDHQWSTTEVTVFPSVTSPPAASLSASSLASSVNGSPLTTRRISAARPTAVVWWQSIMGCHHTAIVGTETGTIFFVNLSTGVQVGTTYVRDAITELHMCQDNSLDVIFLLITCINHSQWKLLLEQRTTGYTWPVDSASHAKSYSTSSQSQSTIVESDANGKSLPRSRLQGLKQLSVEKLTSIRNKLVETRSRGIAVVQHVRRESSSSSSDDAASSQQRKSSMTSSTFSEVSSSFVTTGPLPESLSAHVGETFLSPQYARGRYLLSGYYTPSSILTIHGMDLEVVPLFVHKLPPECGYILVTDRFLFVTDSKNEKLSVISTQLSESRLDGDTDYNPDSVINSFGFKDDERILSVFKHSASYQRKEETNRQGDTEQSESRKDDRYRKYAKDVDKQGGQFVLPQKVSDLKIDAPSIDSVIIVTNHGLYEVKLSHPPVEIFMELILEHSEIERAERLALIFGLNLQQLLEMAGDLKLSAKDFPQAIALYKLSRCRHLKSVLKFAVAGHSAELLGYINLLLETTGLDLTTPERIHLANLAVMAHSEQVLRATAGKPSLLRKYLKFLCENPHYDEVLAVNVAGQTGLWDVLHYLCGQRGLQFEVLEVLAKAVQSSEFSQHNTVMAPFSSALWRCLSEPSLLQALICRPIQAGHHLQFVSTHLPYLGQEVLERLAALYDPSSPVLWPAVTRLLLSRQHKNSCSSSYSGQESFDITDSNEDQSIPIQKMITVFLIILLYLAKQRNKHHVYLPELMERISLHKDQQTEDVPFKKNAVNVATNMLSAGFAHVAVVRNSTVYTWGNAAQGCLGTGPTMSRFGTPHGLSLFPNLKVEVSAVACGRQHTLALTSNGVYAWGSSQFGQLGIGSTGQSSTPILISGLASELITSISAGQYHSLALTADGRVYSWGWGVHGQLGIGSIEDALHPKLVKRLNGQVVKQISGGHGHSLFLTETGEVFTCGSSVFGQLGNGGNIKSSTPVLVSSLPETCVLVSTGYFHNLALSTSNKLYCWGSSPQVLRLQAQAHKKARLMQKHTAPAADKAPSPPASPHAAVVVSPTMEFKGLAAMGTELVADHSSSPQRTSSDVLSDKEGQHHLLPQEVDTSLVTGTIVQLSCGCHHSALLTSNGTLYVWGRNLDGQLGTGSRKEVLIPTPVASQKKQSPASTVICGGIPEDSQLQQVSCGCEFTTALEAASGRLWAWGSNAHGQLGRPPLEEGKALEGRLIMLKTSKRVIKLPQGAHNACDMPQEVTGVPSNSISFQAQPQGPVFRQPCPSLNIEDPPYGPRTLHFALQHFHGHYDSAALLSKCVELENYQAAAKLALLGRMYHQALSFQLKALTLAVASDTSKISSEEITIPEASTHSSFEECQPSGKMNVFSSTNKHHETAADKDICTSKHSINKDKEKSKMEFSENHVEETSQLQQSSEFTEGDSEYSVSEHCRTDAESSQDISVSSTPENLLSLEIHPFAIQGGKEQMSEETRYLMSPDSPSSLPPGLQTPDLTSSLGSDERCPSVAPDVLFNSALAGIHDESNANSSHCNQAEDSKIMPEVRVNGNTELLSSKQLTVQESNAEQALLENITKEKESSKPDSFPGKAPTISEADSSSSGLLTRNDIVKQVTVIMEYYISVMEEDSHTAMSHLLQEGIEFWLQNALPVNHLEDLLLKYMSKLFFPLGLQLFCKEDAAVSLSHLSPDFCLQLSAALLNNIEQTKRIPHEFAEVLAEVVAPSQGTVSDKDSKCVGTDQLMETVLSSITDSSLLSLSVNPSTESVVNGEQLLAFTCGHQCPQTVTRVPECPATSRVLQELYASTTPPLACPHCVMGYLQERKATEV